MKSSWPADLRVPPPIPTKRKGKRKEIGEYFLRRSDAPLVEFGIHAATTLVNVNGRLKWDYIRPGHDQKEPIPQIIKSVRVTPESYSDGPSVPEVTAYQRAEQGKYKARFLRTYYPEVDVGMDILQPFLMEGHQAANQPPLFSSHQGNCLAVALLGQSPSGKEEWMTPLIISTSGEIGACLNAFPFSNPSEDFRSLVYSPSVLKDFKIPILQILVGPTLRDGVALIAVRLPTKVVTVSLTQIRPSESQEYSNSYTEIDVITLEKTNSRPIVDMVFNPQASENGKVAELLLVNEGGCLWIWDLNEVGTPSIKPLYQTAVSHDANARPVTEDFWRIAWGTSTNVYVMNSQALIQINTEISLSTPITALMIHETDGNLASILSARDDVLCICSSRKVFWVDAITGVPLMIWDHGREDVSNLQIDWLPPNQGLSVCLSHAADSILTIFPVLATPGPLLHAHASSYAVSLPFSHASPSSPRRGLQLVHHPLDTVESLSFYVFDSTSLGSIVQSLCAVAPASAPNAKSVTQGFVLPCQSKGWGSLGRQSTYGPLGARESTTLDLRAVYEELFLNSAGGFGVLLNNVGGHSSPNNDSAVDKAVGDITGVLLSAEPSAPLMRITSDIFLGSRPNLRPLTQARYLSSGFFETTVTKRLLSGEAARRALFGTIRDEAAWSYDFTETVKAICPAGLVLPTRVDDFDTVTHRQTNPEQEGKQSANGGKRANAHSNLAIDLVMALNVWSTSPFKSITSGESLSRITPSRESVVADLQDTTAMLSRASLVRNEPPPIQYGFLAPTILQRKRGRSERSKSRGADYDHDVEEHVAIMEVDNSQEAHGVQPVGVQLLLKEWTIGEDPRDYNYVNPYTAASDGQETNFTRCPIQLAAPIKPRPPTVGSQTQIKVSQRPTAPPTTSGGFTSQEMVFRASQPVASFPRFLATAGAPSTPALRAPSSSQVVEPQTQAPDTPWASTQPVAGAFGSRTNLAVKAKAKKRVEGF
ncbi:hypothetical protein FRB96_002423 [Tulasnella sp. 330]|nr:hypothetical protein FRB96_002423 [Tulasnella sp. 330]